MGETVEQLRDEVASLEKLLIAERSTTERLQKQIEELFESIRLARHKRFGAASEKAPGQGELFDEAENECESVPEIDGLEPTTTKPESAKKKTPARKPLPATIPRIRNVKTQLVTAENLAIDASGSPDTFTLNYTPGLENLGQVKFIGEALPQLPMTGIVYYADGAFTGKARTNLPFSADTPIDVTYRFQDGAGTADVDILELRFTPDGLQPQSLVKALRGKIADVSGLVSAQIKLAFAADQPLQSSGTAQLKSMTFGTLPGPLSDVNTQLSFSSFFPLQSQGRQTLTVSKFDPGFPLEDGVIEFELIPDGVKVYNARWPMGSGAISLEPFDWLYSAAENRVVMRVEKVSLGEFLNDVGGGALEATGDIEGALPIVLAGVDVKVDNGYLTVKNGGIIKYKSDQIDSAADYAQNDNDAVQALREHRYRDAVFQALQEFQYRSLTVKMDGPLDGAIEVGMEFDGSNKDVLNNQPFRFNINVEGELLNIIRSFNTNDQIKSELARRRLTREGLPSELE